MTSPPSWLRRAAPSDLDAPVDLDGLLALLVDGLRRSFAAERATLYLVDRAHDELVSRVAYLPEIHEIRLEPGEGAAGRCAETGRSLRIDDAETDPRATDRFDLATGFHTRNLLVAPLLGPRRERQGAFAPGVVGVIQVLNKPGGFTPDDQSRLEQLAADITDLLLQTSLRVPLADGPPRPLAFRLNRVVGDSPAMHAAADRVLRAAPTDASVLLRGESGTGKELLARAVHANSPRRDRPLVKVDCAALPAELIENELFGHERGAFTSAARASVGKVAAAEGGTLFLDEIGDLPRSVQGKLLRLLQDRAYYRIGGNALQKADVRFVAATHIDLERAVREGRFRRDLYFRLRVVEVPIPPLRERGSSDIDRLADHFLLRFAEKHGRPDLRLSGAARLLLQEHSWPGNVRELENAMESAVVLAPGPTLDPGDFALLPPEALAESGGPDDVLRLPEAGPVPTLREVEDRWIRAVLDRVGRNRTDAAELLGIGRNTLARRLRQMGEGEP